MSAITLTPEQAKAAHTIDRSLGIVANAGSGKTRVLVERVAQILATGNTSLRQILVVTFTEKAAQELKKRLTDRLQGRRLELMTANITTFHGFATRVLREHAPTLGLSESFRIASEGEAAQLLHRAIEETLLTALDHDDPHARLLCERYAFRSIVASMTPLLEDRWSFEQYVASGRSFDVEAQPVINAIISVFQNCSARYKTLKGADDLLDFHDLEILTWQLFRDDPKILADYQRQFRHLLVDEFQDTNPLQAAIVRQLFTPPDNVLCIVGDPKQSIYRFRRADVGCFARMLTTILDAGGETVVLPENFRSRKEIIDFVNTICAGMPHYTPLIAAATGDGEKAIVTIPVASAQKTAATERRHQEAQAVADALPALAGEDGFGSMACLFQARSTLQLWADVFRRAGLPVHIYGSGGYWQRSEIRGLLFCLQVLVSLQHHHPDERHLLALLLSPLAAVSPDQIYRWMYLLPAAKDGPFPPLHQAVMTHSPFGEFLRQWTERIPVCTPTELMTCVVRDTRYLERLDDRDPTGQQSANVSSFIRRLHDITRSAARPLALVVDQLLALQDMAGRTPDTPATLVHDNAIQMMTIHAAKGNEFPTVILPDLFRKPNTRAPNWLFEPGQGFAVRYETEFDPDTEDTDEWTAIRDQYLEEERAQRERLLYVALTRAEKRLIFPVHPEMKESKKGRANWHDLLRQ